MAASFPCYCGLEQYESDILAFELSHIATADEARSANKSESNRDSSRSVVRQLSPLAKQILEKNKLRAKTFLAKASEEFKLEATGDKAVVLKFIGSPSRLEAPQSLPAGMTIDPLMSAYLTADTKSSECLRAALAANISEALAASQDKTATIGLIGSNIPFGGRRIMEKLKTSLLRFIRSMPETFYVDHHRVTLISSPTKKMGRRSSDASTYVPEGHRCSIVSISSLSDDGDFSSSSGSAKSNPAFYVRSILTETDSVQLAQMLMAASNVVYEE